jgi:hypothetical protein
MAAQNVGCLPQWQHVGALGRGGGGDSVLFAYWVSEGRQFGSQQFIVFIFALVLIDMAAHWT